MLLSKIDVATGKDHLGALNASEVVIDTTHFDNNLSSSDSDLQTALETIDEISNGGETVNIETLAADKTLTATDATVQILQTGSANRIVNLPTTGLTTGAKFIIWNNDVYTSSYYIQVKQSTTVLDNIYSQKKTEFYWDGTNWYYDNKDNVAVGYYANGSDYGAAVGYNANGYIAGAAVGYDANGSDYGAAVGRSANGYQSGAAVGRSANGYQSGAAVGRNANGYQSGAAIGYNAKGYTFGVAVGYDANGSDYGAAVGRSANGYQSGTAVGYNAKGYTLGAAVGYSADVNGKGTNTCTYGAYSKAERNREFVSTATSNATNKAQMTIQKYAEKDIPNSTGGWFELFVDATSSRLVLLSNSVYNFCGEFNCYRTITNDEGLYPSGAVKGWQIKGLIKNVAGAVSLIGTPTITLLGCDADIEITNVDLQIEADNINDSLKISVYVPAGTGGQTYRFSGNIFASETRA